jgi:hypothetical protein
MVFPWKAFRRNDWKIDSFKRLHVDSFFVLTLTTECTEDAEALDLSLGTVHFSYNNSLCELCGLCGDMVSETTSTRTSQGGKQDPFR